MKNRNIQSSILFLLLCLVIGPLRAEVYFTVKLVNSPGHVAKDIIILNFDEVAPVSFNDSMATYIYKPEMATNLLIVLDRSTRWHSFAWINADKDNVQLIVDFSLRKVSLAHPKNWDEVMEVYNAFFDNDQRDKADSVASIFINANPDSYFSLWMLSHGAAFENKTLRRKLFNLLDKKFFDYPEYKEVKADLNTRRVPKMGESFKEFELTKADGQKYNTGSLQDKVIVLHLWSNNCGPCVRGMDDLVKFNAGLDQSKVEFISVGLDDENAKWKQAPSTNKIKWTNLWQEGGLYGDLCMNYNLRAIPSFIIFDKNKKLQVIIEGEELSSIQAEIDKLLK
ncbi:MAG: TlpA disulfide reductase family protein [Bacteroidota bacterium]